MVTLATFRDAIVRRLIALDVFLNVIFLNGELNETISAHAAKASLQGKTWGKTLCTFLRLFDPNH